MTQIQVYQSVQKLWSWSGMLLYNWQIKKFCWALKDWVSVLLLYVWGSRFITEEWRTFFWLVTLHGQTAGCCRLCSLLHFNRTLRRHSNLPAYIQIYGRQQRIQIHISHFICLFFFAVRSGSSKLVSCVHHKHWCLLSFLSVSALSPLTWDW